MSDSEGKLVIVSGPSGAGKSTVIQQLLTDAPVPLVLSVSATTRPPRKGEIDGLHYHFLSHDEFLRKRRRGEFLECMEVFGRGDWYGTLADEVKAGLEAGKWVLLEIDVEGTMSVLKKHPHAVTIFIHPGSLSELEVRLRKRGSENEESLARRLEVGRKEMEQIDCYRYEVINDSLDNAIRELNNILNQEKSTY